MNQTYPIAEIFVSPQGEGLFSGTRMCFVRTAGCNVGKPYTLQERAENNLQIYQEKCTSWQGNNFACDTNYRIDKRYTIEQLLAHELVKPEPRICLTGGEPLMHEVGPLLEAFWSAGKAVHIETSGTKAFQKYIDMAAEKKAFLWIAVSPKAGYTEESIKSCNEIKVLVDQQFDTKDFERAFRLYLGKVWLQPINYEMDIDRENLELCLQLQTRYKIVRISTQMHKIWRVR